jgi:hypothetical protein
VTPFSSGLQERLVNFDARCRCRAGPHVPLAHRRTADIWRGWRRRPGGRQGTVLADPLHVEEGERRHEAMAIGNGDVRLVLLREH